MIELPEARTIAKDLRKEILNKEVTDLKFGNKEHKFAFYTEDKSKYKDFIMGKKVTDIIDRNFYVEVKLEDYTLLLRDGVILKYFDDFSKVPDNYQMLIEFDDEYLVMSIAMYGMIYLFKTGTLDNKYYDIELKGVSPVSKEFDYKYFKTLVTEGTLKLSAKAFIATEQRFLGIGNGVSQDILFNAKIHPKKKLKEFSESDFENLFNSIKDTLNEMIELRGRDTEKDIYGNDGKYISKLSKKTLKEPCKICSGEIKKEAFLGGSIYFCSKCQSK